mgnify:CR=1 FL=1
MQILLLSFNNAINTSLQVGDAVYHSAVGGAPDSGFSTSGAHIRHLGTVTTIDHNSYRVSVMFDETLWQTSPDIGDYIMFGKNKAVNSSSLIGYYADVKFVNYDTSTEGIELFSVSSEVSESSK